MKVTELQIDDLIGWVAECINDFMTEKLLK